jgi:hypothetical protein
MREKPIVERKDLIPAAEQAFGNSKTRAEWRKARRRVTMSLIVWPSLWLLLFAFAIALGELDVFGRSQDDVVGGVGGGGFVVFSCVFCMCLSRLWCLKRIRRVLETHAWRPIPAARRRSDIKDVQGVTVQLCLGGDGAQARGDDEWTELRSARGPIHRRRWPEAMERGAWYAGEATGRGVLALPGGSGLMEVAARP